MGRLIRSIRLLPCHVKGGEYPGPASQLSDPFTVETGTVYYVGTFGPEFFLDFEGAQAAFIEQFGEPAGIEFRMAYGQEVEDL